MGVGAVFIGFLVNAVIGVTVGCNLGQMGDADDLVVLRNLPKLASDDAGGDAADSGVDLVKDHGRYIIVSAGDIFDGKHDS